MRVTMVTWVARSGVGMLLFCVKHARLEIMNPARELSKMHGVATIGGMKDMKWAIKHALDAANLGLRIEPCIATVHRMLREVRDALQKMKQTTLSASSGNSFPHSSACVPLGPH